MQMTALPDRDVVFVRFQNEASSHSCLPYFIAIDEHSHSVGQCSFLLSIHAVSFGMSTGCVVSQPGTSSLAFISLVARHHLQVGPHSDCKCCGPPLVLSVPAYVLITTLIWPQHKPK